MLCYVLTHLMKTGILAPAHELYDLIIGEMRDPLPTHQISLGPDHVFVCSWNTTAYHAVYLQPTACPHVQPGGTVMFTWLLHKPVPHSSRNNLLRLNELWKLTFTLPL